MQNIRIIPTVLSRVTLRAARWLCLHFTQKARSLHSRGSATIDALCLGSADRTSNCPA